MMPGNAGCMHISGEFCERCYPENPQKTIEQRIAKIENTISDLMDIIAKIANHYYREKNE